MPNKQLGRAKYRALRFGHITILIATGETPNFNDKTDFEQLPLRIFPPMYGFYFIHADISLPALRPFVYEEAITFPASANRIRIQDADGIHEVAIEEIPAPAQPQAAPDANEPDYCVFSLTGNEGLLFTAKCDAILPAIYSKVFGPDTYANCQRYIKEHQPDPR